MFQCLRALATPPRGTELCSQQPCLMAHIHHHFLPLWALRCSCYHYIIIHRIATNVSNNNIGVVMGYCGYAFK